MNFLESFGVALAALTINKLRAALTMLGLTVGVAAVILLLAVGHGVQQGITAEIRDMGSNLLVVMPGKDLESAVRASLGGVTTLTMEDAEAIAVSPEAPSVVAVAPVLETYVQVAAGREDTVAALEATTTEWLRMVNFKVAKGEPINREHVEGRASVTLLGAEVAKKLFKDTDPVGEYVKINGVNFRVIGVMERKGGLIMAEANNMVVAPLATVLSRVFVRRTPRGNSITSIMIQAASEAEVQSATAQVESVLRRRHRLKADDDNDFVITNMEEMLSLIGQVTTILTAFLGLIAAISLIVGGIGIMNIMLVSVTERTREIGIRKAVGAKRRDILAQFLVEAVVLCLLGGAAGISVGWGLSSLIGQVAGEAFPPPIVSIEVVVLAFSVSAVIGIVFGIYPAARAARLHPIDALRYE